MVGKNDELTLTGLICLAALAVLCVLPAGAADTTDGTGPVIFDEQFSSTTLDPAWSYVELADQRGRYSLTEHPGFFRFYGESWKTSDDYPWYPGWVDVHPDYTGSDYLYRTFDGDRWVFRASPTYNLHGWGGQTSVFRIAFGEGSGPQFIIGRHIDLGYGETMNHLSLHLINTDGGEPASLPLYPDVNYVNYRAADDVFQSDRWIHHTYWYEIIRDELLVTVRISTDGTNFVDAASFTLPPMTTGTQQIAFTQPQWDIGGSYTDWDYVTVHGLVSDNQPPVVTDAYSSVSCLWPPNHKFVEGQVLGVTDPDGDPVTITISGITSDEPTATDIGSGGATHSPDASGVGTSAFTVRAERSGDLNGRVYAVTFTASDGKPNGTSTGTIYVTVPCNQGNPKVPCTAVDDGQKYDATAIN